MNVVDVTLVTNTSAYADNDVLAIPQVVHGVFTEAGGTARLRCVQLLDEADHADDIDLLFFNADVTLGTINDVVAISDADARKLIGRVSIVAADYCDLVNSQVATKTGLDLIMKAASSSAAGLYIAAVLRSGTPTHAVDSLKLKLGFAD